VTLRAYIRRHINTWDLQRVGGLSRVELEERQIVTNYSEDTTLEANDEDDSRESEEPSNVRD
jgi:hypothetical protein